MSDLRKMFDEQKREREHKMKVAAAAELQRKIASHVSSCLKATEVFAENIRRGEARDPYCYGRFPGDDMGPTCTIEIQRAIDERFGKGEFKVEACSGGGWSCTTTYQIHLVGASES